MPGNKINFQSVFTSPPADSQVRGPASNASQKALRWTKERAAAEFGINPRTLTTRLLGNDIQPGEDGRFTTAQITAAVFGDMQGERLRKIREEADNLALRNSELRGQLVDVVLIQKLGAEFCSAIRAKIIASALDRETRDEILEDLAGMAKTKWTAAINKKR